MFCQHIFQNVYYFKTFLYLCQAFFKAFLERVVGIEPTFPAWKAGVLPIYDTRMLLTVIIIINIDYTVKFFYITSVRFFCNISLNCSPIFLLVVAFLHISNQFVVSSFIFSLISSWLPDI